MSLGGGGSSPQPTSTTQTTTQEPPAFLRPFITGGTFEAVPPTGEAAERGDRFTTDPFTIAPEESFLQRAFGLSTQPFPFSFPGDQIVPFNPLQQAGLTLQALQSLQVPGITGAAAGNLQQFLGGDFSGGAFGPLAGLAGQGGLPFPLEQSITEAQGRLTDVFNTQVVPQTAGRFARAGIFGGTAQQETEQRQRFGPGGLSEALSSAELGLRRQASEIELGSRDLQTRAALGLGSAALGAAGLAPELGLAARFDPQGLLQSGAAQQSLAQQIRDTEIAEFLAQAQFPFQQLDVLGGALTTGGGGAGTTSAFNQGQFFPPSRDPLDTLLGAGLLGSVLFGGK